MPNKHSVDVYVSHVQGVNSLSFIAYIAASAQTRRSNVHVVQLTTHHQVALQRERRRDYIDLCRMSPAIWPGHGKQYWQGRYGAGFPIKDALWKFICRLILLDKASSITHLHTTRQVLVQGNRNQTN